MIRKHATHAAKLALVVLLLGGAPAAAAEEQGSPGFLSQAWEWVWSLWADEGMCIDPNGAPCAAASADEGACIDPDG